MYDYSFQTYSYISALVSKKKNLKNQFVNEYKMMIYDHAFYGIT